MHEEKELACETSSGVVSNPIALSYFGYNSFVIRARRHTIVVDPGANLSIRRSFLSPLIPRDIWRSTTHIIVTHGDPDHYWYTDLIARESGAPVICGTELARTVDGETRIVSPRDRVLRYGTALPRVYTMDPGDRAEIDGIAVEAIPATHGAIELSLLFGLIRKRVTRENNDRFALGCTGFILDLSGYKVGVLGDTLLKAEWKAYAPDLLIIPIGGHKTKNTMDEKEALRAVDVISPKVVVPCHYECGFLFWKNANPADVGFFHDGVTGMGRVCKVMKPGEELLLPTTVP